MQAACFGKAEAGKGQIMEIIKKTRERLWRMPIQSDKQLGIFWMYFFFGGLC